jgi:hypothetical protein
MTGLRVLLILLLVLNGTGALPAAALAGGDCCYDLNCDCGCDVPQVATLPVSLPPGAWGQALPEFAFAVKSFHGDPNNAPFRPPA